MTMTRNTLTGLAVTATALVSLTGCSQIDGLARGDAPAETTQSSAPNYYTVTGTAVFDDTCPEHGTVYTGVTDRSGRIGPACAVITGDTITAARARGRQDFAADSDPAGWGHNAKVAIDMGHKTYHGYMFNRSHLIADSLGGDPTYENLITGTRTQNVGTDNKGGMAYTESQVRDFYAGGKHRDCATTYEVTPNYTGDEIIPRTNTVNVRTCDKSIDESVTVNNTVAGYQVNYRTGTFTVR